MPPRTYAPLAGTFTSETQLLREEVACLSLLHTITTEERDEARADARASRLRANELDFLYCAAVGVGRKQERELCDLYAELERARRYEFNATSDEIELRARIAELEAQVAEFKLGFPDPYETDDTACLARTAARIRQNLDARTNF